MNLQKYLSECHNVEATYFACEDWGAFLCTKCGEKCKADEVKAAVECGTLMHASDGMTCANIKPCFLHDPGENKKWRERNEPKDDIERIVEDAMEFIRNTKAGFEETLKIFLLSHGKAEREKEKAIMDSIFFNGKTIEEIQKEAEHLGYTKGIEDSIAAVSNVALYAGTPSEIEHRSNCLRVLEALKNN